MIMNNNQKIIADTCMWIEFFRTKSEVSGQMCMFIADNQIVGTGTIIAELLQGVRGEKERNVIVEIFSTLDYIEMTQDLWIDAGNIARELRSNGKTIPLSDISIACCAKEYDYKIFTIDKHFKEIPDVRLV